MSCRHFGAWRENVNSRVSLSCLVLNTPHGPDNPSIANDITSSQVPSREKVLAMANLGEVDGPEDFTQDLERWMRGTGPYKQGEGPATPTPPRKATVEDAAEIETPLRLPESNASTIAELRRKLEEQSVANRQLKEDVAHMQSDNQKLYDRLQQTMATVEDLKTENEEQSATNQGFQEEIEQLEADKQELEADKHQLEAEKQGMECHRYVSKCSDDYHLLCILPCEFVSSSSSRELIRSPQ